MRRLLAVLAIMGMVVFIATPANAAPECRLLCVDVAGEEGLLGIQIPLVEDLVESLTGTVERVVEPIVPPPPAPVPPSPATPAPTPAPAPGTVRPQAPAAPSPAAPAPQTNAPVAPTPEAPVNSAAPTEGAAPTNAPTGQDRQRGGTVGPSTSATAPSPRETGADFPIVPDDPDVAAATFSILGLLVGILLGIIGLFVAYKRGRTDGEQAAMDQFLADLHETGPKHGA